jgi:hypothetical protein
MLSLVVDARSTSLWKHGWMPTKELDLVVDFFFEWDVYIVSLMKGHI